MILILCYQIFLSLRNSKRGGMATHAGVALELGITRPGGGAGGLKMMSPQMEAILIWCQCRTRNYKVHSFYYIILLQYVVITINKSHSYHIFISYVHRCRYMSIFIIFLHQNACSILQCHENFEVSYLRLVFVTMQTETAESDMT